MGATTSDPNDPRLGHGPNDEPTPMNEVYLVLSEEERKKKYTRPYRETYRHDTCGSTTTMAPSIAQTYARNPSFYGSTYCVHCQMHRPLTEFNWVEKDGSTGPKVGT